MCTTCIKSLWENDVQKITQRFVKFNISFQYQFGFSAHYSTYLALIALMDKLIKPLDNGELVLGVFLDLSKAFDTVNHAILRQKRNHNGIRGCALKWLES